MKKFLIILLLVLIAFFVDFSCFEADAYAKAKNENKISYAEKMKASILGIEDDFNEKQEVLDKEQREKEEEEARKAAEAEAVQTSAAEETYYVPSVTYGTFGRIYVSGYSAALYDYNVYTNSSLSLQEIVDNWDSAAYYTSRDRLVIADHSNHGFDVLYWIPEGTTAYIKFEDGSTIAYRLIYKSTGYNTGPDLVDNNENSFFNMDSDIIMYTCYGDGIMATLWSLL